MANLNLRTQAEQAAVAAERSRLAHDLNDSVTQTLFAASLIAEVLPQMGTRRPAESYRLLAELRERTRGAQAEMCTLLLELQPTHLMEVTLPELLQLLTEVMIVRAHVPTSLQIEGEQPLPHEVKVGVYRVAQETLNNVAKHAHARQATVTLHQQPAVLTLTIADDGRGFSGDPTTAGHLGLRIMQERAAAIGA